jgi:propanol-preferring alcohol dehydrogenase
MKAWILDRVHDLLQDHAPLELKEINKPEPRADELLLRVICCGVCHTELDEIEGRAQPNYPVIPGHQVVGEVETMGADVQRFQAGDRVGVAWIASSCGKCAFCLSGEENLCSEFKATGCDVNGGYAEYMVVKASFAYLIPENLDSHEAAPLLCAGAIGYRSLMLSQIKDGQVLGLSGFGASGHLVLKTAQYLYPNLKIIVFARSKKENSFARSLGAHWAGTFDDTPPFMTHAIIDTTPVWYTIVQSLEHLLPAGRLVINAIRKESIDQDALLQLRYQDHLWMEKEIKSVANITRVDVRDFLLLAAKIPIKPEIELYSFDKANQALIDLKHKHIRGAKVLTMN